MPRHLHDQRDLHVNVMAPNEDTSPTRDNFADGEPSALKCTENFRDAFEAFWREPLVCAERGFEGSTSPESIRSCVEQLTSLVGCNLVMKEQRSEDLDTPVQASLAHLPDVPFNVAQSRPA